MQPFTSNQHPLPSPRHPYTHHHKRPPRLDHPRLLARHPNTWAEPKKPDHLPSTMSWCFREIFGTWFWCILSWVNAIICFCHILYTYLSLSVSLSSALEHNFQEKIPELILGCMAQSKIAQCTLPETNLAHENPIFPGKSHQNGGFSMAMLVYRTVIGNHHLGLVSICSTTWSKLVDHYVPIEKVKTVASCFGKG